LTLVLSRKASGTPKYCYTRNCHPDRSQCLPRISCGETGREDAEDQKKAKEEICPVDIDGASGYEAEAGSGKPDQVDDELLWFAV
jgi:hypothetical protein